MATTAESGVKSADSVPCERIGCRPIRQAVIDSELEGLPAGSVVLVGTGGQK